MGYVINLEGRVLYLPLRMVKPGILGRDRNTAKLQELSTSVSQVGILQPLTVRKLGETFQVISGNRRLMAARMVGLGEVPCILLNVEEAREDLISLTELLHREDLHYLEEAEYLRQYLLSSGLTQSQAAKKLGRSQSAVANKIRLLNHPTAIRQLIRELELPERHARELLRIPGEDARRSALTEISRRGYSVAQVERYIDNLLKTIPLPREEKYIRRETRQFLTRALR